MAYRVSIKSGDLDAADTFGSVSNTPTLHATTNIAWSTSALYTLGFTAPNTTNKCLGAMLYFSTNPVSGDGVLTVTLQANSAGWVDVAGANVSVNVSALPTKSGYWLFFLLSTPPTYATTSAGYYRFKLTRSGTYSVNPSMAADSGGSNAAFFAVDDRSGAIGTTDDLIITGANAATDYVVTIKGDDTCGSKLSTETATSLRSILPAIQICPNGELIANTAANCSLTVYGNILVEPDGKLTFDESADVTKIAQLIFKEDATGDHGILFGDGSIVTFKGASLAYWRTKYSSGVGTAANPLILSEAVDWTVGDEILICASSDNTTNYQETEKKFIKTKNSSASYVISDTVGGAEAALTYTHNANAWVVNLTRNVVITTTDVTKGWYATSANTIAGNCLLLWLRMVSCGTSTSGKYGITVSATGAYMVLDYCVSIPYIGSFPFYLTNTKTVEIWTGNVVYQPSGAATCQIGFSSVGNKTVNDWMILRTYRGGFYFSNMYNCTVNRAIAISCGAGASTVGYAGLQFPGSGPGTIFNDCEAHACRYGVYPSVGYGMKVKNALIGTRGKNNSGDFYCGADLAPQILFYRPIVGSDTLISGYLSALPGTEVILEEISGTAKNNWWYTNTGVFRATGDGLSDTTVHTAGGYCVRMQSESSVEPLMWTFDVPTGNITAKSMTIAVWVKINNADYYAGTHTNPKLSIDYDNGTVVTVEALETTDWQLLSKTFTPATDYGQITITIDTMTDAAGSDAYVYWADWVIFYPAGYALNLGNMSQWAGGQPVTPPISTLFSAKDIWTAPGNEDYGVDTMGKTVQRIAQIVDDNQALIIAGL